jgi:hypothetical protein
MFHAPSLHHPLLRFGDVQPQFAPIRTQLHAWTFYAGELERLPALMTLQGDDGASQFLLVVRLEHEDYAADALVGAGRHHPRLPASPVSFPEP